MTNLVSKPKKGSKELVRFFDKRFLDVDSEFASSEFGSIAWEVSVTPNTWRNPEKKEGRPAFDLYGSIRITDCNKNISLDVGADTIEEIDNRIDKVKQLVESLKLLERSLKLCKKTAVAHLSKPRAPADEKSDDDGICID